MPALPRSIRLAPALRGRLFARPVELGPYPGERLYLAQQDGLVLLLTADGGDAGTLLDLRSAVSRAGNEEGLLGVALDPDFPTRSFLYAYYSVAGGERRTRLARFRVAGDRVENGSELVILEQPQPFANHKGGALRFGPDGMLYLGLGDGGSQGDPGNRAQDRGQWLGKILRIDVRNAAAGQAYVVPADNPFATQRGARPEIWALGFRNPWRIAFDAAGGTLWVGDVGQDAVEEVDIVQRGANYGWRRFEGASCYGGPCDSTGLTMPVASYTHAEGCSVSGGVVYRGRMAPTLIGWYLLADFCSGRVWATDGRDLIPVAGPAARNIAAFGTDAAGEVYLLVHGGPVLRVVGAD